jgi:hypothetical protein
MKFTMAVVAYLVIGAILGVGILMALKGNPWLLVAGVVGYLLAFGKCCLPKKSH